MRGRQVVKGVRRLPTGALVVDKSEYEKFRRAHKTNEVIRLLIERIEKLEVEVERLKEMWYGAKASHNRDNQG